jgi:acetyl esterase/lipase
MARRRTRWFAAVAAVVIVGAGWLALRNRTSTPRPPHLTETVDYLPHLAADVFLPDPVPAAAPVVVLVPGGAWRSADRSGLGPLADSLAARGMVVVNATYRAADAGVRFPVPVQDIVCAVDFAADRARQAGVTARSLVLVGHSSGAHLAALAALAPRHFRGNCPHPPADATGFVGLAGPYELTTQMQDFAEPLFGRSPGEDPAAWRSADPLTWVAGRELPVLLVHGEDDDTVGSGYSISFAHALRAAGDRVQLTIVPGADHASIYSPGVVSGILAHWIDTQSRAE